MYEVVYTGQFKKSLKRCERRGLPIERLVSVVNTLRCEGRFPEKYKPHRLVGQYEGC